MKYALPFLAFIAATACSSTGVVPMDRDTYMVSKRTPKIGFVNADDEKAEVYRQANDFCARQNKQVETVKLDMVPSGFARQASASLEFRCVAKTPNSQ